MSAPQTATNPVNIPDIRADMIRRLFPISLTVGFAGPLGRILLDPAFVHQHDADVPALLAAHWREMVMLLVSSAVVIASWEGYQAALVRTPLHDRLRYFVDVAIVFTYLLLEQAVQQYDAWFSIFALIFAEYVVWDILRLIETERVGGGPVARAFGLGSIAISAMWTVLALLLWWFEETVTPLGFACSAGAAFVLTLAYRFDKRARLLPRMAGIR